MNHIKSAPPIIKEFLLYMQTIMGKSEKTVNEYYFDLRLFFRFIKREKNLCDETLPFEEIPIDDVGLELVKSITMTDLYEFMGYLYNDRKNKAPSRARKVACIRSYFKYLTSKAKVLSDNPAKDLDSPKLKKGLPKYLSLDESRQLLSVVDGEFKERDFAILTLFLNCGLRVSELVGLNYSDLKEDSVTVTGKGDKERTVYLNDACRSALEGYLKVRLPAVAADRNALFLSKRKKRISVKTVQWAVKKYITLAGLDPSKYSAHKLRHTAATLLHKYGQVDIRTLQEILGHEHVSTTQIYTHVSDADIKDAMNKNPLSAADKKPKEAKIK